MKSRFLLFAAAVFVLTALVAAPQTRWLVRLQVLSSLRLFHPFPSGEGQSYAPSQADSDRRLRAALARRPGDFGLQYARAAQSGDSASAVAALRPLESRFPDRPALYAGILRRASFGLHWNRTEENALYATPMTSPAPLPVPNDPAALAAFDADAARGRSWTRTMPTSR